MNSLKRNRNVINHHTFNEYLFYKVIRTKDFFFLRNQITHTKKNQTNRYLPAYSLHNTSYHNVALIVLEIIYNK